MFLLSGMSGGLPSMLLSHVVSWPSVRSESGLATTDAPARRAGLGNGERYTEHAFALGPAGAVADLA